MELKRTWLIGGFTLACGVALYVLAPVLTPFVVAILLAYIGDPWVDKLELRKLSRTQSVLVVFGVIVVVSVPLPVILAVVLEHQLAIFVTKLPTYLSAVQQSFLPWLQARFGVDPAWFDAARLSAALSAHWQQVGGAAAMLGSFLSQSSFAVLGALANFILIPVVAFYVLRDWDILVARVHELIPRTIEPTVARLTVECDAVIAAFLRGQLSVMLALGVVYILGLWIVGLDISVLIGLGAGLVSFVPYLGFVVGIVAASIAAAIQFHDVFHLIMVWLVFGVGQVLESMVLTPILLGDRIGLHPVMVIFAVMVGGHLFGFFGILLALPVAAVAMVLLRHAHARYLRSDWYGSEI